MPMEEAPPSGLETPLNDISMLDAPGGIFDLEIDEFEFINHKDLPPSVVVLRPVEVNASRVSKLPILPCSKGLLLRSLDDAWSEFTTK